MRSSKNRSRSKNNRNRSVGNIVNRVFDSSGPEGKVRGTPQQIIEKYNQLARDAQLSNDRVAAENFQQHAEHYLRMLGEAQKEMEAQREQQEREQQERRDRQEAERAERQRRRDEQQAQQVVGEGDQPDLVFVESETGSENSDTGLVETPEDQPKPKKPRAPRKPRKTKAEKEAEAAAAAQDAGETQAPATTSSDDTTQAAE
ncbi:DUF4167 domain-containing protein [Celeribacter persicus]|jgi:hypothetical protein|uniref:Uncharacterized protein DUF4167 n=1 Tax=Celeribacter persicus TaxID=1651082 RepID=A0A2T5HUI9_9RHOB|nr:DUF4167 domain-containing protein [Celeribacter persicus]PTQ75250.1 uncharacterized protein DUF4167 [Celeribacter persicus]